MSESPDEKPVLSERREAPRVEGPDDEGIEVTLGDDGKVVIHARCRPGEDPSKCAERVRFLVEALGEEGRLEVEPPPAS